MKITDIKNLDGDDMYEMVDGVETGSCTGCVFDNELGENPPWQCEELLLECIENDKIYKLKEITKTM